METRAKAVVTGAGSGIGRETVQRLVHLDYEVVALGRREASLRQTADEMGDKADRVHIAPVDVQDGYALEQVLRDVGPVHALVANAGICVQSRLDDPNADEVWKTVMGTNVDGVWNTFRAIVPSMPDDGRVVVVSSGLGKLGRGGYSAYTASKHAVLGLVKCVAMEVAPRRITVNAVCPGWVATEMAEGDLERTAKQTGRRVSDVREEALRNIPLGRFVKAGEVASLISWLLSTEAAAVTGQAYNISCGEFFA